MKSLLPSLAGLWMQVPESVRKALIAAGVSAAGAALTALGHALDSAVGTGALGVYAPLAVAGWSVLLAGTKRWFGAAAPAPKQPDPDILPMKRA